MGKSAAIPERNIVLIGSTGHGKSNAGNMILKKKGFITKASANPVTTECQRGEKKVNRTKITVIDTPDFFDIEKKDEEKMKSEIVKALVECAGGIHAIVIVLKVGRYTTTEKKMVKQLLNTLTEDAWKLTVILFTFGEQLEGQDIKTFVKTNLQLQDLYDKCKHRCHVIDKSWKNSRNEKVMKKLLETIDEMVKCYSNELFKKVKEQIQEEMMKKNAPEEEAKNNDYGNIRRWLAQAAIRMLVYGLLSGRGEAVSALAGMIADGLEKKMVASQIKTDSACDSRSEAESPSHENAITLMKKAQTELEKAKYTLENATAMLQKKQTC